MKNFVIKKGSIALLLVLCCSVLYFLVSAQYLYEWDSVNYALGVEHYDPPADQPHAPGYFLWILLMRLVMALGAGPNTAQILLANLFTALGLAWLYALARSWFGSRAALLAVGFLCTSSLIGLYSAVALNYPIDLFASCALAYLAFRLARGDYRLAPVALGLLALLAGIRQSGSLFLAPLVLFYFLAACRTRPGWLALSLAAGGILGAAWLVPTLKAVGGWSEYLEFCREQTNDSFNLTTVFRGAPWSQQINTTVKAVFFLGVGLAVPLAVNLIMLLFKRRRSAIPGITADDRPSPRAFFALWLLPGLAFVLLLHSPKPGYVLPLLPGLGLALAVWMAHELGESGRRTGSVLALVAVLNLTLFLLPYDTLVSGRFETLGRRLGRCGLASIRHSDLAMDQVLTAVKGSGVPADCCYVVVFRMDYRGPNWRKLAYYLPEYRVGYVGSQSLESGPDGVSAVSAFDLPACTTRIWWVTESEEIKQAVMTEVPGTQEQFQEGGVALLYSTIPPDFPGLEFNLRGCRILLRKAR